MKVRTLLVIVSAALLSAAVARAQTFHLRDDAFGSAGGFSTGSPFNLGITAGQSVTGVGSEPASPHDAEDVGFWFAGVFSAVGVGGPGTPDVVAFALYANAPNPFGERTTIRYAIPTAVGAASVKLRIYDLSGRMVRVLDFGTRAAGIHSVTWDGRDATGHPLGGGVYFCRIDAGAFSATRRLVLTR